MQLCGHHWRNLCKLITKDTHINIHACTHSHTQFMEDMAARYDEQAREAGVYIVFSCGFDSIPNDMGALLLQRTFNGELSYVESYMAVHDGVSYMFASVLVLSCRTHTHTHRVASMLELGNHFSAVSGITISSKNFASSETCHH